MYIPSIYHIMHICTSICPNTDSYMPNNACMEPILTSSLECVDGIVGEQESRPSDQQCVRWLIDTLGCSLTCKLARSIRVSQVCNTFSEQTGGGLSYDIVCIIMPYGPNIILNRHIIADLLIRLPLLYSRKRRKIASKLSRRSVTGERVIVVIWGCDCESWCQQSYLIANLGARVMERGIWRPFPRFHAHAGGIWIDGAAQRRIRGRVSLGMYTIVSYQQILPTNRLHRVLRTRVQW